MELKPRVKEAERTNASVMYSLQALDYLETEGAASLNDLSAALSINKSRVLRLCGTLEQMGYLRRRAEDAKWVLGSRLLSLGKAFERQNPLLQVLRPEMLELSQQLDENVVFQVIRGERRLCLCAVNRVQRQRYFTPEGSEARLHYGAAGKVLLAWGPPELRARIYEQAPYPRYTEHTRTTAEELMADIEKAAAEGWATSCEERTYGSAALAVGSELMAAHGPDSPVGRTAAVMLGSTETTFYVLTVYLGAAGTKRARRILPAALCADLTGFVAAAWCARLV